MKFTLSITDASAAEMAKVLAAIGGTANVAVSATPAPQTQPTSQALAMHHGVPYTPPATANHEDDESGDQDAQPGTVDKEGIPWDERIHSTPAKLTGKGVWRKRRGIDDATVAAVEKELSERAIAPATETAPPQYQQPAPMFDHGTPPPMTAAPAQQPAPQFTPPTANVPMPQTAPAPAPQYQQPAPQQMPAPAPVHQQPVAAPHPVAPGSMDFSQFMQKIGAMLHLKNGDGSAFIDAPYLGSVAQRVGQAFGQQVNAITDLASNQQMIDYAIQIMQHEQRWAA